MVSTNSSHTQHRAASEYTLWYLQTLHIHNTEQICFQLFVTRGILLIIELENNTKIENIVTEDMKYHEMAVFHSRWYCANTEIDVLSFSVLATLIQMVMYVIVIISRPLSVRLCRG